MNNCNRALELVAADETGLDRAHLVLRANIVLVVSAVPVTGIEVAGLRFAHRRIKDRGTAGAAQCHRVCCDPVVPPRRRRCLGMNRSRYRDPVPLPVKKARMRVVDDAYCGTPRVAGRAVVKQPPM